MNSSRVDAARGLAGWSAQSEAFSVYQAMTNVTDSRRDQGKRYSLALRLPCVLLAKMAGETTLQAIAEWIRLRGPWLQTLLPETRGTFPCAAAYSTVLRRVDPEQATQVLMDLLTRVRAQKRPEGEQRHVVLDGKTLRGTQHHVAADQQNMHHVNCYEARTGIVLKQHMVAAKEGEVTRVKDFLTPVLLHGRIISADALYAQTSLCHEADSSGRRLSALCEGEPTDFL